VTSDAVVALLKDYELVFSSPAGRRVLDDLESKAFVHKPMIGQGAAIDPYRVAFNEGNRNIVLSIKEQMKRARELGTIESQTKAVSATAEESG
jgi:hypothetical protein